jgi:hypothetical protein
MRSKLGCLALRLKLVKAKIDASCAGVAPTFMAEGGRVPCAGDSDPNEDSVRSPNPLLSPSSTISSCTTSTGARAGAGLGIEDEACLADVLVLRVALVAFDAGVRFLVVLIGTSSAFGSAPVIIRSASSTGSGVFSKGFLLRPRVDFACVTRPSLSSLKLFTVSVTFAGLVAGFATSLGGAAFATRVVADVILVRLGRGIVAVCCR